MSFVFVKELTNQEADKATVVFSGWERKNLTIVHGKREKNAEWTYGLPYTSSGECAELTNTNVSAEYNGDKKYKFRCLLVAEGESPESGRQVVAELRTDSDEEKHVIIGSLDFSFKKEWSDSESSQASKLFAKWEKDNLSIKKGERKGNVADTYGLPYTSHSEYAMISCTNVEVVFDEDEDYFFKHIAITEAASGLSESLVVVVCCNKDEEEKLIVIGSIS
jgi:hypothetical protein